VRSMRLEALILSCPPAAPTHCGRNDAMLWGRRHEVGNSLVQFQPDPELDCGILENP
jgi:hypothetical protein